VSWLQLAEISEPLLLLVMFVLILPSVARQLFSLGIYLTTITKSSAPVRIHPEELEQTFNPIFCTAPPKITVKAKSRSYCCLQTPHGKVRQTESDSSRRYMFMRQVATDTTWIRKQKKNIFTMNEVKYWTGVYRGKQNNHPWRHPALSWASPRAT